MQNSAFTDKALGTWLQVIHFKMIHECFLWILWRVLCHVRRSITSEESHCMFAVESIVSTFIVETISNESDPFPPADVKNVL